MQQPARAQLLQFNGRTAVEPPLVETMLVRRSCVSTCLLVWSCAINVSVLMDMGSGLVGIQPCLELSRPKCSVGCAEPGGDLRTRSRVA